MPAGLPVAFVARWHAIGSLSRMRSVYSAIFVGFAVVGFAGVFNPHSLKKKDVATTDSSPAHLLASATPPSAAVSAITVETELVEPAVIRSNDGDDVSAPRRLQAPRPVRRTAERTSRSRLARFVFGDGQFRPHPFPTPASDLK
jgi:hypothetical protein